MIVVDSSAWIEYFRDGQPLIVSKVDRCLERDLVGIGDLIYRDFDVMAPHIGLRIV